jgi:putative transcriptional regulator
MKPGKFLIATPSSIGDTNFQRSVVLLVEQKESGTIGFILNKKLDYNLDEVMEGVSVKIPLYFGGPVEQDSLFLYIKPLI